MPEAPDLTLTHQTTSAADGSICAPETSAPCPTPPASNDPASRGPENGAEHASTSPSARATDVPPEHTLAAYRAAARALDDAIEALLGDDLRPLVGAFVGWTLRAQLHLDLDRLAVVAHLVQGLRAEHRGDAGGPWPWAICGTYGDCDVLALAATRPDWVPAEAVTP